MSNVISIQLTNDRMTPISVSIIVPCYNASSTLDLCIDGLLAQAGEFESVEILIIDNNSSDDTAAIAGRRAGVTLLHAATQGAYAARNAGVRAAQGDFLVFTDPDCVPKADWLTQLMAPFASSEVKITNGRSLLASDSVAMRTMQDYEHVKDGQILGGSDPDLYYGHTNNMAVRREVFDANGPFDERMRGGDVICIRRCIERWGCEAVCYVGAAEVVHLEMDGIVTYIRKVYLYGWSNSLYSQIVPSQVAEPSGRWALFRSVCRDRAYALPRQLLLLGLMGIEGFAWWLGTRRGRGIDASEPTT